jgi:hypothetical protein
MYRDRCLGLIACFRLAAPKDLLIRGKRNQSSIGKKMATSAEVAILL